MAAEGASRRPLQAVALASRARRQPRSSVVGALRWLVAAGAWVVVPFVDDEIPCLVGRVEPPPP